MKFNLLNVYALFSLAALVGSHAVTPEVYWHSALPNSPMPKAIKNLLYTAGEKNTMARVGKGNVGVTPKAMGILLPRYIFSADELKYEPNEVLFFLENDLHQGTEVNLHLVKDDQTATFLPRQVADSIPFSSNKLPQIYNKFSIKSNSVEAKSMKETLSICEREGEERYCATSLESMVDYSTQKLGKRVKAISTEVNVKGSTLLQKYTIKDAKKLAADKAVVCHNQNYVYAVFYCHKTHGAITYAVSLVGMDGTKVKGIAVCHKLNPEHLAFQVLKVKPGSVRVCHILPENNVVWVPY